MSRLAKCYARFREEFEKLTPETAAEFEARVSQAADALKFIAENSDEEFRWKFLEVLSESVMKTIGVGGLPAVRLAMAEGFPWLHEKCSPLLELAEDK